ncbi:MAG: toxin-antitoxin system YwqK family antitoxin [Flavobacteriales bacterium]|nr:toxin-antitoxin system YwqK family antitoxin [Flavobacteriales bacterium]
MRSHPSLSFGALLACSGAMLLFVCMAVSCNDVPSNRIVQQEDARTLAVVSLRNGSKDGPARLLDGTGNVRKEGHYVRDHKEGQWRTYDPQGKMLEVLWYHEGTLHGTCTTFSAGGSVVRAVNYAGGVLHGAFETYHPDGSIALRCIYANGSLNGHYFAHSWTDSLLRGPITECWYEHGHREGIWTRRYGNGQTSVVGIRHRDVQDGVWRYWDRAGNLKRIGYYRMGVRYRVVILRREEPWFLLPMG